MVSLEYKEFNNLECVAKEGKSDYQVLCDYVNSHPYLQIVQIIENNKGCVLFYKEDKETY